MAEIKAAGKGHLLEITDIDILSSGSSGVDTFNVTLDEEWADLTVRAVFYTSVSSTRVEMSLEESDGVYSGYIPQSILSKKCRVFAGLIGTSGDLIYTSTIAVFDLPEGARTATQSEISVPDIYQQMQWIKETLDNEDENITKTVGSTENKKIYYLYTTGTASLTGMTGQNGVEDYVVYITAKQLSFTQASAQIFGLSPDSVSGNTYTWGDGVNLRRYNLSVIYDGVSYVMFICAYPIEEEE